MRAAADRGVEPLEDDVDWSQREIDVSVEQDGAKVRARREVVHRSVDRADETVEERLRRLFGSPELGRRWRSFEVVR